MSKIITANDVSHVKPNWIPYLITFKDTDRHPFEGCLMENYLVRIIAPDDEAAKLVLKAKFGKSYYQLHREREYFVDWPVGGIFETLVFKK